MAYDAKIRTYANEMPRYRTRGKEITSLIKEEGRLIKGQVLLERGASKTFARRNADFKRNKDKRNGRKGQDKGRKGKGRKGDGENKFRGTVNGDRIPTGGQNNDWGSRPTNDWGDNKPPRPRRPATRKLRRSTNLRIRRRTKTINV